MVLSLATDTKFVYLNTNHGLMKVGSGYQGTSLKLYHINVHFPYKSVAEQHTLAFADGRLWFRSSEFVQVRPLVTPSYRPFHAHAPSEASHPPPPPDTPALSRHPSPSVTSYPRRFPRTAAFDFRGHLFPSTAGYPSLSRRWQVLVIQK